MNRLSEKKSSAQESTLQIKLLLKGQGYEISTEGELSSLYDEIDALVEFKNKIIESLPFEEIDEIDEMPTEDEVEATPTADIPSIRPVQSTSVNINALFSTNWGNDPRNMAEIIKALEINGVYLPMSTLGSNLLRMVRRGDLRRIQRGGKWAYYRIPE